MKWSLFCEHLYDFYMCKEMFWFSLVGDNRVPLSLWPVTCVCLHHISHDWILLVSMEGLLLLLYNVMHIDVLHLFRNAACCNHTKLSISYHSTVCILHDSELVCWIYSFQSGKSLLTLNLTNFSEVDYEWRNSFSCVIRSILEIIITKTTN